MRYDQNKPGTGTAKSIRESNAFNSDIYVAIGTNVGGTQYWNGPGPGVARGNMAFYTPRGTVSSEFEHYGHGLGWSIVSNVDNLYILTSGQTPNGGRNDKPGWAPGEDGKWDPYITCPHGNIETDGLVNAPSVIIRNGFRDNAQDAVWIRNNIQLIARAYVIGISLRFGFHPEPLI